MFYDQATIDLKVSFALLIDLSIYLNSNVFISNANENKKLDHIYQHNQYIKNMMKRICSVPKENIHRMREPGSSMEEQSSIKEKLESKSTVFCIKKSFFAP